VHDQLFGWPVPRELPRSAVVGACEGYLKIIATGPVSPRISSTASAFRTCDALAAIYESMYGKAPKHMTAAYVLRACEKVLGLPGDADWEERMAAVELLNELRK